MGLGTQTVENAGQFDTNVSGTNNGDSLWLFLKLKKAVGRNTQLITWDVLWEDWRTTGCNEDFVSSEGRDLGFVILVDNLDFSVGGESSESVNSLASLILDAMSEAYHITFLGTHPTLTHVPPIFLLSTTNAEAPYFAALLAEATPPEPPPITKY
ncbi:hypothetical protein OGAPHI_004805 [Ogataea philodendri]|uniref:Uncharacterized protein n=1 Tax=Ogataea philodendri TaxID=1378263 RepID=A0A9P8P2Z7_9ASCO|nr:uncharacterized protein OGAPHI_004805 [Ogataea philodendri]KAH3664091.1 hypothetical protein OGAPHI_004805 [Ogataea philodendri]